MKKLFLIILLLLFLLILAGCTSAPKQPTPVHIDNRPACPLTLCVLPARELLLTNDDWRRAVDDLEDELLSCSVQVKNCIEQQKKYSTTRIQN